MATTIIDKLKVELAKRGAEGIAGLGRNFRINDKDKSRSLDFNEFSRVLSDCKLGLSADEAKALFAHFDHSKDKSVSYDEFLRALRGEMNLRRKALVLKAFRVLDSDKSGVLDLNDLKGIFDAKSHPKVKSGEITEEKALDEWLNNFELYGDKDGKVTLKEFEAYYSDISASIDSDDYFVLVIENAYRLREKDGYVDTKTLDRIEQVLRDKIWQKAGPASANDSKTLIKAFKYFDTTNSNTVTIETFTRALERFGIILKTDEMKALFDRYDLNANGKLEYSEFSTALMEAKTVDKVSSLSNSAASAGTKDPVPLAFGGPNNQQETSANPQTFRPSTARGQCRRTDNITSLG
mmetsp:Transcript_12079/g.19501  ORF Transcript_12079/g.19501 Transcript_12079/m.19501 type:complete len:351 (-) Transcript_12079:338-1390(-)|eukprot:CAMPEP_0184645628 /NCGR_PEP_ID=MMETSP0308-20130426/2137_1 /TAXON_ID=38269 /ORGANISM="Gloeochaete witrockiana, Strain SAG 46.84" /LENGTH=350 /DNA_ID=CAMNT_0027074821 /DNA_START=95 /DNA_END=1147 /DNA_ORIENTATION=+